MFFKKIYIHIYVLHAPGTTAEDANAASSSGEEIYYEEYEEEELTTSDGEVMSSKKY